jgi:aminoglycoside phosphotransferase (APT) family kinase protein
LVHLHRLPADDPHTATAPFVERQLTYWHQMWHKSGRQLRGMDDCFSRLSRTVPRDATPVLLHGDPHLDNAIFSPTGRLLALLDWELSARGPALIDLAHLLLFWSEDGELPYISRSVASQATGFPTRDQLVRDYAERSGSSLEDLPFYEAFTAWRLACGMSAVSDRLAARPIAGASDAAASGFVDGDLPYEDAVNRLAARAVELSRDLT